MYSDKERTTIVDRREMLRVKLKSLAEEARIIRHEEQRVRTGPLRHELYIHRTREVRNEARAAHVAYGLIRGRTMKQLEGTAKTEPDWTRVKTLLKKYGPAGIIERVELKKAA